ncbi:MAG: hypothetical protein M3328_11460 [Chloroflexota bacterium]|nr:hypothetical protein [Chloroflexota bacterium]
MKKLRHVCLTALALALTSCGPALEGEALEAPRLAVPTRVPTSVIAVSPTGTRAPGPGDCPVTRPPEQPFVPPPPYSPSPAWAGAFWYGTNLLWTQLPVDGAWEELAEGPHGYTQKVLWWREGYSWKDDPSPDLTVTGRRLDAPAPPLRASRATNAFAEDIQSAMLIGVDFPAPGCWEVTGKVTDRELSFVIWVGR